jgi:hypothetical protein
MAFFMQRFAGMTFPVARFLVRDVFCILDHPTSDSTLNVSAPASSVYGFGICPLS